MNTLDKIKELAEGWVTTIDTDADGFVVTVVNRKGGDSLVYRNASLDRAISSAWAGEPTGEKTPRFVRTADRWNLED